MKRAILLGWIVVLVCMAILSQYRNASAVDGEENRITDSYRVDMYPVQNEGLNATLANSLRWITTHVPLDSMRIYTHSTGIGSGTTPGLSWNWNWYPQSAPFDPGSPFMPSPTNYSVSFEDGGMTITAYYDPDSSNVAKGPVIFLDSGNSTLNAAPFVYVDLVASGTCPGCPPPCYLPCCYTPGGPCMPSDPIDVVFKLEIK